MHVQPLQWLVKMRDSMKDWKVGKQQSEKELGTAKVRACYKEHELTYHGDFDFDHLDQSTLLYWFSY